MACSTVRSSPVSGPTAVNAWITAHTLRPRTTPLKEYRCNGIRQGRNPQPDRDSQDQLEDDVLHVDPLHIFRSRGYCSITLYTHIYYIHSCYHVDPEDRWKPHDKKETPTETEKKKQSVQQSSLGKAAQTIRLGHIAEGEAQSHAESCCCNQGRRIARRGPAGHG
jgi:hypothetical protein